MKIVTKDDNLKPPAKCAVTSDIEGPFLDTGSWLPEVDPYIYLHVPLVEQWARELGFVDREDYDALLKEVEELRSQAESYFRKNDELNEVLRFVRPEPEDVVA